MQMEALALGWLVLIRTDSPFLVGLIASARMALNFLALFSGTIADRVPRHRLLAAVMFITSLLSLAMFTLLQSGRLEVWHIFTLVLAGNMEAMGRGWEDRDSSIVLTLQEQRAGVQVRLPGL